MPNPEQNRWKERILEICKGDPIAVTWIAMTEELIIQTRRLAIDEAVKTVDWILTPHAYESDDPNYESFALELKARYRKEIIKDVTHLKEIQK